MVRKKEIGKFEVISIAIGSIIGTGAFLLPGDLFLSRIGFLNTVIGITLGAFLVFAIEKNYSFLIKKFPKAGGEYIFVKNVIGQKNAFICGWLLVLSYFTIIPLNATAVPVVIDTIFPGALKFGYLYSLKGDIYFGELIVGIISLLIFLYFNIKGIKFASMVQNIMVFFLVGIVLTTAGLLMYINGIYHSVFMSHMREPLNFSNILKILSVAPFLFIGFDCIPQITEELNFDTKKLSLLAGFSIFLGGFLYICLTFIASYGLTKNELLMMDVNWAAGYAVELFLHRTGVLFLGFAFFTAIVAGINGFYMSSSRLMAAMAEEGDLPSCFAQGDKGNPVNALILLFVLSCITVFSGRNTVLWSLDVSSVGAAMGYLYTSYAAYKLYHKEGKFSLCGIIGIVTGGVFVLLLLVPVFSTSLNSASYITLLVWCVLGAIFKSTICKKIDIKLFKKV
ncbi:APC family permease [Fusobacterium perfoetens]|uniref:APC family permease n=1 Tax=Fusobacterium perfoetens TaxID=852 RepID=UPI001F44783D|nr:APC family permease [Fusobacterium perfoetens]MCF2625526.1 APC family permease [Fusobacterium perfoetens]